MPTPLDTTTWKCIVSIINIVTECTIYHIILRSHPTFHTYRFHAPTPSSARSPYVVSWAKYCVRVSLEKLAGTANTVNQSVLNSWHFVVKRKLPIPLMAAQTRRASSAYSTQHLHGPKKKTADVLQVQCCKIYIRLLYVCIPTSMISTLVRSSSK